MNESFINLRLPIGKILENKIFEFFEKLNFIVLPTESLKKSLTKENQNLLRQDFVKKSKPILMLRYIPDFIVIDRENRVESFFLDTKVMFTPVYLNTLPDQINRNLNDNISFENIGLIEREAYMSYMLYQNAGVKVAILCVCTYNPNFIFCDFVENIKTLFVENKNRNSFSSGSTTPRVNIDLRRMSGLEQFMLKNKLLQNKEIFDNLFKDLNKIFNFIGLPKKIYPTRANEVKLLIEKICKKEIIFKNLD